MGVATVVEPTGREQRLRELRFLLGVCKSNLEELEPLWMLNDIPQDRPGWKELFQLLAQHQGLAIARSKLIAVAKDLVKEIGVIERKEKDGAAPMDLERIKNETSIDALDRIIHGQEIRPEVEFGS